MKVYIKYIIAEINNNGNKLLEFITDTLKNDGNSVLFLYYTTINSSFINILKSSSNKIIQNMLGVINSKLSLLPKFLEDKCSTLFGDFSKVNEIQNIYPALSTLFIQSCLIEYNNDIDKVFDAIENNNYTPHLENLKNHFDKNDKLSDEERRQALNDLFSQNNNIKIKEVLFGKRYEDVANTRNEDYKTIAAKIFKYLINILEILKWKMNIMIQLKIILMNQVYLQLKIMKIE